MKIKVRWEISYDTGVATFDLEDVNCQSKEEWDSLTETEREELIQDAIDNLPDGPSMILDSYSTT